jgi:hypothetical protein
MTIQVGIPEAAMIALTDMVDHCAGIEPGMEVLLLAHKDGLYGGVNLVDEEAVAWTASVVQSRGAHASILWIDDPRKVHEWRYQPITKAAVVAADVMINFSSQLVTEEMAEFRRHLEEVNTWMVRMFPVTAPLLMTDWAQTPYELTTMIRHVSSDPFMNHMAKFVMTDPNGTHLEGRTLDPVQRPGIPGMPYNSWRKEASHYIPFPEWVHPPINCQDVNGVFNFNCMLSWWSPYIGIDPEWETPISIEVEDSRMVRISGGCEADALRRFLESMVDKVGDGIRRFDTFHFGIHPNAKVGKYQCPHDLYRRIIDHSHHSDLHAHIGSAPNNEKYAFYPHITGDLRNPTLTVGGTLVYDQGYLCCLDDPRVKAVADKYPGRPGVPKRL